MPTRPSHYADAPSAGGTTTDMMTSPLGLACAPASLTCSLPSLTQHCVSRPPELLTPPIALLLRACPYSVCVCARAVRAWGAAAGRAGGGEGPGLASRGSPPTPPRPMSKARLHPSKGVHRKGARGGLATSASHGQVDAAALLIARGSAPKSTQARAHIQGTCRLRSGHSIAWSMESLDMVLTRTRQRGW